MTLSERLEFCKICEKRKFDKNIGLICSLTEAKPEFEEKCTDIKIDEPEARRVMERKQALEESEPERGFFAVEKKGMKKGVLGGAAMLAIALIWFFVGLQAGYIYYYPPVLAIIGIVGIIKGLAEGNMAGEKYKKA
jgi:hypothetical protein